VWLHVETSGEGSLCFGETSVDIQQELRKASKGGKDFEVKNYEQKGCYYHNSSDSAIITKKDEHQ